MAQQDITILQGSRFSMLCNIARKSPAGLISPWDLTNLAVRAEIRRTFDAVQVESFTIIVTDAENGQVRISLGATQTELLKPGSYRYDVEVYDPLDPDYVYRVLEGQATVTAEVTRG